MATNSSKVPLCLRQLPAQWIFGLATISRIRHAWILEILQRALAEPLDCGIPIGSPTCVSLFTYSISKPNFIAQIILIPNLVAQTCLLVGSDTLTDTQHGNCTHFTSRTYGTLGHNVNGVGVLTGANLLDVSRIGIDEGLLNLNASQLTDAYMRVHDEAVVQNAIKADGIRADGSFGQHTGIIYNGNYGKD